MLHEILAHLAFLLELKSENPFKIKAYQNAARLLEEQSKSLEDLVSSGEIAQIPGIGKGTQAIVKEFVSTGKVAEYETLRQEFPETIFELLNVRGLGPKKIKSLYEELQIASLAELEYACNENRLMDLKGFGAKTQANVLVSIAEIKENQGRLLLPQAEFIAEKIRETLLEKKGVKRVAIVGEVARKLETVAKFSFLLEAEEKVIANAEIPSEENRIPIEIHTWSKDSKLSFEEEEFRLSSSLEFWEKTKKAPENFFWIPAEARELESALWDKKEFSLLEEKDIRGVFHAHTKWSDGANTLEEMVEGCIAQGYEYFGVSDHSQSAFYANGLKVTALREQQVEIAKLKKKFPKFRIFHGVESDILPDGSLDYPEEILRELDFVIASVHGQFKMTKADMTKRITRALKNPYTTWLGHSTGRLLLGRKGYEYDIDEVLNVAAGEGKGIELNSNPYRLDLDWRHLQKAKSLGVSIGVFPDAHSVKGLEDVHYGVLMARKGGLMAQDVSNTMSADKMDLWLRSRR